MPSSGRRPRPRRTARAPARHPWRFDGVRVDGFCATCMYCSRAQLQCRCACLVCGAGRRECRCTAAAYAEFYERTGRQSCYVCKKNAAVCACARFRIPGTAVLLTFGGVFIADTAPWALLALHHRGAHWIFHARWGFCPMCTRDRYRDWQKTTGERAIAR